MVADLNCIRAFPLWGNSKNSLWEQDEERNLMLAPRLH